jgi:RNA polymerase sigma-70 factor (ECF subfamily)
VNLFAAQRNKDAMDNDEQLIARIGAGEDAALRELVFRHTPWLGARLNAVLPAADAEDVLQETFLAVWKNAKTYRPRGAPEAWLWVIARNQAAQLLRKRGPAAIALLDEGPLAADPAESAAARADLATAAAAALGPPGRPEREVWRLLYEEDRPVAEVAELMGVPEGTVKSRAHRARRLLRAALGGNQ